MDNCGSVKRHLDLQTIAKQKLHAEFDLATLSPMSAVLSTSTLVSGVSQTPSTGVQQWRGVALDPTEGG